jgi:hypothetical protein
MTPPRRSTPRHRTEPGCRRRSPRRARLLGPLWRRWNRARISTWCWSRRRVPAISSAANMRSAAASPACSPSTRTRPAGSRQGAGLCTRHRRNPRRRDRDDLRRRDRDRSVRRAGRAVRRRQRADRRRLQDAGRRRLQARGRLFRMPARAQADRRPDVRRRLQEDAHFVSETAKYGDLVSGPRVINDETKRADARSTARHPERRLRPPVDRRERDRQARITSACGTRISPSRSRRSGPSCASTWPGCRAKRRQPRLNRNRNPELHDVERRPQPAPTNRPQPVSGARLVVEALEREGVKHVFGYPGGAIMPVYDALTGSKLKHILVRHEQAAALAADAYGRVTGEPGVCLATSGPGRPTSSPASPTPSSTACRWSRSPARSRRP